MAAMLMAPVAAARSSERPLWEIGIGAIGLHVPDYRGAEESRSVAAPFPVLIYRGERLRADRDGLRGELFESDRIELNLSLGGALPVRSGDNEARRGMPRLDFLLEAGPTLNLTLARSGDRRNDTQLQLPVRTAFTLGGGRSDYVGAVFGPQLRQRWRDVPQLDLWSISVAIGPQFSSRRYHDYVYGIAPQFATASRPAYAAPAGYSGSQFSFGANRAYGRWRLFGLVRVDALHGAAFADSPLVRRRTTVAAGIGLAVILGESSRRVPSVD
jgi:outer membrane protein